MNEIEGKMSTQLTDIKDLLQKSQAVIRSPKQESSLKKHAASPPKTESETLGQKAPKV